MKINSRLLLFLLMFSVIACKDEEDEYPVLKLDANAGMQVSISWSKVSGAQGYKIWRDFVDPGSNSAQIPAVIASVDANTFSFVDKKLPISNTVNYYVTAVVGANDEMKSNVINTTGRQVFNMVPYQMALLPGTTRVVVRTTNEIVVIDSEEGKILKRLSFNGTIGVFSMAKRRDVWELYVPCNDGNVYICDAGDPEIRQSLRTGSYAVACVAANNQGWLAVSTSDYYEPVRIYQRETLSKITNLQDGYNYWNSRLMFRSDYELVALSMATSSAVASLYRFDAQGSLLSRTDDPYAWEHGINGQLMNLSDQYLVAGNAGKIFSIPDNFTYQTTLNAGGQDLMDFQFSADGRTIYSAISSEHAVLESVLTNGQVTHTRKIPTIGYPWLLARNGDEMIVLSSPERFSPYSLPGRVIVETISLK